jgi:phenylacetic acid degradation operon negative regulatory protein
MTKSSNIRAFTARSVIASTLLGTHPPVSSVRVLVRSGVLFGISEGTIRVALTRMVAAGELATNGDGRYELIGQLRTRQDRQQASRLGLIAADWDGTWEMAVVRADRRSASERNELRVAMGRLRFAELREGVWLRPNNLSQDRLPEERAVIDRWVTMFSSQPHEPKELAAELWDLASWAVGAEDLLDQLATGVAELRQAKQPLESPASLGHWFSVNAAVRRHLLADPLLPAQLLPRTWPGRRLRTNFERFDEVFLRCWRSWLSG